MQAKFKQITEMMNLVFQHYIYECMQVQPLPYSEKKNKKNNRHVLVKI